ncbi:MAG TPA: hypothetical protein VIT43_05110 [Candidatus Dormibacteraeota bacterium]
MARLIAIIAAVLMLAGCGAAQSAPAGTGIQGMVVVGPTCPVERLNSPCPPHPLAATVVIRNSNDVEVARVTSGRDGRFQVDLPAGSYTLVGQPINGNPFPRPTSVAAVVQSGRYTAVTVTYDSGIR